MADTVKLFGSQVKKGYVIAGGLVLVVAVGYGYYRNKQAAATAASSSTDTSSADSGIDPATGIPYADETGDTSSADIDPATGYPYGSAADTEALDQLSGGYGYGGSGGYGGYGTIGTTGGYSTNGQWAQAAEDYLASTIGSDPTTVAAALGKYITGQALTADQIDIVEQAIAFEGYPPVNGPNGDPPSFVQTTGGGSPPPTGSTVAVPNVVGKTVNQAQTALTGAGFAVNQDETKDKKGFDRIVTATNPKAGTKAAKGSHVGITWHFVKQK